MTKKDRKPLVSIVILNWNRLDDTLECLKSVRLLKYPDTEIIIVDNGSVDGSKAALKKIEDIIFVNNKTNKGFTGGHIDGFNASRGEYVLILNNDAVIDRDYLDIAIKQMERDEQLGAIGGRAYEWNEQYSAFDTSNPFFAYQNINPVTGEAIFDRSDKNSLVEVNNVSGSGVVLRRSVIDHIGYLHDPFFAYYEETDLFARMKRANYSVKYHPGLHIWHKSGSSSSSYFQFNQLFKNRFLYAIRNFEQDYVWPFIKSYVKTGLKSTLLRFRKTDNPDLHKAFSDAFVYTLFTWPKAFISRRGLAKEFKTKNSYNQTLLREQTNVGIIVDIRNVTESKRAVVVSNLESLQQKFTPNIDINILVPKGDTPQTFLHTVEVTKFFAKKGRNLGWLSSNAEFVVFSDWEDSLDVDAILERCVLLQKSGAWIFSDDYKHTPIHKELLIHSGGFDDSISIQQGILELCFYAHVWGVSKTLLTKLGRSEITSKLTNDIAHSISIRVHRDKDQDRPPTRWERFLERHYRFYQQRNLFKWLFSSKITLRLKIARTKNLFLSIVLLNRTRLATELKHIRNEVFRTTHAGVDIVGQNKRVREQIKDRLQDKDWSKIPVFVICRDRIDSFIDLAEWLRKSKLDNVVMIDNDSIYPPLLKYFEETSYQVIHTHQNVGHTVPWSGGIIKALADDSLYIVTDPDVIPIEECPDDTISYLLDVHLRYFDHQKVGFGLKIDDLPEHYHLRQSVINWETQFFQNVLEPELYEAGVDTTFALYKPYTYRYIIHPSIRTGGKYMARHLPWYLDSKNISQEEQFYRDRVNSKITSWNVDELAERYKVELKKQPSA